LTCNILPLSIQQGLPTGQRRIELPTSKHLAITPLLLAALLLLSLPANAAEAFRWLDADGQMHTLEEYRGKPVILHVWASWCGPCRNEMPELSRWILEHPDVPLLVVSVDESQKDAADFLKHKNIDAPLLLTDGREASSLGIRVLPSTLVFAGNGEVKRRMSGSQAWTDAAFNQALLKDIQP